MRATSLTLCCVILLCLISPNAKGQGCTWRCQRSIDEVSCIEGPPRYGNYSSCTPKYKCDMMGFRQDPITGTWTPYYNCYQICEVTGCTWV